MRVSTSSVVEQTIEVSPAMRTRLRTAVKTYLQLASERRVIDAAMDKHKDAAGAVLVQLGVDSLNVDADKATMVRSKRTTLDPKKLLELGVSMDIIEAATVTTENQPYVKITGGKA